MSVFSQTVWLLAAHCAKGVCGRGWDQSPSSWPTTCNPWRRYHIDWASRSTTWCWWPFFNTTLLKRVQMKTLWDNRFCLVEKRLQPEKTCCCSTRQTENVLIVLCNAWLHCDFMFIFLFLMRNLNVALCSWGSCVIVSLLEDLSTLSKNNFCECRYSPIKLSWIVSNKIKRIFL